MTRMHQPAPSPTHHRSRPLPDPGGDHLHGLTIGESVSDLDPVILTEEPVTDLGLLDDAHAASVDKPQRATAQRHANPPRGFSAGMAHAGSAQSTHA